MEVERRIKLVPSISERKSQPRFDAETNHTCFLVVVVAVTVVVDVTVFIRLLFLITYHAPTVY